MLFMSKWKTGDSTIWRGKLTKQENGTHFKINAVIKTSPYYCVLISRTENDVIFKETIIL